MPEEILETHVEVRVMKMTWSYFIFLHVRYNIERIIYHQTFQVSEDGTILQSTDVVKPKALI